MYLASLLVADVGLSPSRTIIHPPCWAPRRNGVRQRASGRSGDRAAAARIGL